MQEGTPQNAQEGQTSSLATPGMCGLRVGLGTGGQGRRATVLSRLLWQSQEKRKARL